MTPPFAQNGVRPESRWYALSVKSRSEFVTEAELRRKGYTTFLPSVKKISQWTDRKKEITVPVFPGYLFVSIAPADGYLSVLRTRGAVCCVSLVPGEPTPVPDEEVISLQRVLASGEEFDIYPELSEGVRVSVKRGPLAGACGVIAQRGAQYRLLVSIEILGRTVSVPLYADALEAA